MYYALVYNDFDGEIKMKLNKDSTINGNEEMEGSTFHAILKNNLMTKELTVSASYFET